MSQPESMCPVCHVGKLSEIKATFTQVVEGQVIVMANVSAFVCDVCGERTMDHNTLLSLSGLLGVERHNWTNPAPWFSWPKAR
jgi:YgiT-type zinc finger domain-containing protein